ncbi:MAG: RecX family transcriptional regulator [Actinomycetota bacterium]|nr:RecX family transcriptional regulator [Actinomycetota bacterium]
MGKDDAGAFELAVGAISRKERTVTELREWLGDRELAPAEVEEAVERLTAMGALDDERFAHCYADDKRELRGWGPERIMEALMSRGIDRHLAEAVCQGEPAADQAERAAKLLSGRGGALDDDAGRGRALAFLARRGYDYEVAYRAVRLAQRGAQ